MQRVGYARSVCSKNSIATVKESCLLGVSNANDLWIVLTIPASLYNLAVVREELKDQCFCSALT